MMAMQLIMNSDMNLYGSLIKDFDRDYLSQISARAAEPLTKLFRMNTGRKLK